MKQLILCLSVTLLLFSLSTNRIQASAPDFPGLPEDNILYGDANDDGVINVLDIITIVNYIMGLNPDPFNFEAADVTNDGIISVLDLISEVNIIMDVPAIPCPGEPTVTYEGQTYNTVKIGDQCWFRENLNVGTKINSTYPGRYQQTDNGIIEKYCYNNDEASCAIYGGLYEWPETMQYDTVEGVQGICPSGWHLPTDNEWKILEGTVDSQFPIGDPVWDYTGWRGLDAGGSLKESGLIHWTAPNEGATNESGFNGLPGGYRDGYGYYFMGLGNFSQYWSSSYLNSGYSWSRELSFDYQNIHRLDYDKANGYSVRCLKGCWPQPSQANAGPDQVNIPGTSTTLAGNTPTYGIGVWHIITGTGGTVTDTTSPTSGITGLAGNAYSLSWTITTQCGSSLDTVLVSFAAGFSCGDTLVDSRDGQSYATVLMGDQCWMAENMNIGTRINSTQGGFQQLDNGTIEKYCYDNDEAKCDTYGGMYEWPEAMQYVTTEGAQGICPPGWHIPTDGEWSVLSFYLGGSTVAGGKMKTTGTIEAGTGLWFDPNTGATNESGFSGLPGGDRFILDGSFYDLGNNGQFWSSSQYSTDDAWYRFLNYSLAFLFRNYLYKETGFSVRCLKETP